MVTQLKKLQTQKIENQITNNKKNPINFHQKENDIFSIEHENQILLNDKIVVEAVTDSKGLNKFYQVPWMIYSNDKNWVPPLWAEFKDFFSSKNPFWKHADVQLFIATKNQKSIGRIAAIIDHLYCNSINEKTGFFGFFESIHNNTCANALLKSAEKWLISKEMTMMQGPINGRIDNGCGFQLSSFHSSPGLLSPYSPEYYLSFAKQYKMKKTRDQISYIIDLTKLLPKELKEKANQCEKSGVKIRRFNRLRTNKELNWWIDLFLETFKDHWGYVPVSGEEVRSRFGVKQLRWIVDPGLFLIAEKNDEPIAYIWSTPDYNQLFKKMNGKINSIQTINFLLKKNQIKKGILQFIGIKKGVRNQNIGSLLNYKILVEMKKRGYTVAEVGWIDEQNIVAHKTISYTGATVYKKFRVFEKNIKQTERRRS
ncbi:MAG: hypothetical protein DRN27_02050 [Thermoplasmata archaeon]|nr:MAG: hypothetical protein DRN27_02050 [Thermoplasmata archaeon]